MGLFSESPRDVGGRRMTPTEDEGDSSGKLSETVPTDAGEGADSSSQDLDGPRHSDKGDG